MKPVQFNTYVRRETGDEYRFIGYAQMLQDNEDEPFDVCVMVPVCSGFQQASEGFKKTSEHTLYFIIELAFFPQHFDEHGEASAHSTEGMTNGS